MDGADETNGYRPQGHPSEGHRAPDCPRQPDPWLLVCALQNGSLALRRGVQARDEKEGGKGSRVSLPGPRLCRLLLSAPGLESQGSFPHLRPQPGGALFLVVSAPILAHTRANSPLITGSPNDPNLSARSAPTAAPPQTPARVHVGRGGTHILRAPCPHHFPAAGPGHKRAQPQL